MYIKYSVDEKLLLLLGFSVAYLLAGASMFEQPEWAITQYNLAVVLGDQAVRVEGAEAVALLEQTVDACRQALQVYTREQFPQQWATTQNNLATAESQLVALKSRNV